MHTCIPLFLHYSTQSYNYTKLSNAFTYYLHHSSTGQTVKLRVNKDGSAVKTRGIMIYAKILSYDVPRNEVKGIDQDDFYGKGKLRYVETRVCVCTHRMDRQAISSRTGRNI